MNRELLTKLYDKAISRCATAEAWKFEEEFCKVVLEEISGTLLNHWGGVITKKNIEKHFGVKLNATT